MRNDNEKLLCIEPEDLQFFIHPEMMNTEDVLIHPGDRIRRSAVLLQASTIEGSKVMLHIAVGDETYCFQTPVVATGNERVVLSGGRSLPVNCIRKAELLPSNRA
jgi:hypothetical protein